MTGAKSLALIKKLSFVIIDDRYFVRVAVHPAECHSPLIVDTNRVQRFGVTFELLEPIRRRHTKVIESGRRIDRLQFPLGTAGNPAVSRHDSVTKEGRCALVAKRSDHAIYTVYRYTVKRVTVYLARQGHRPVCIQIRSRIVRALAFLIDLQRYWCHRASSVPFE